MDESGANEPTPIVHDGDIFLANTSNIVQALDGRTGDLIWQNQVGPTVLSRRHDCDAQPRALSGQSVRFHNRCAHGRAQRHDWQDDLGHANLHEDEGFHHYERTHRRERQSHSGTHRLHALSRGKLLHQRVRRRYRQTALALQYRCPRRSAWRRYLGKADQHFRAGGDAWITGSYDPDLNLTYWGVAQAKPWLRATRKQATKRSTPVPLSR